MSRNKAQIVLLVFAASAIATYYLLDVYTLARGTFFLVRDLKAQSADTANKVASLLSEEEGE